MSFHFDYESTSACDIKLGSYRYASDPSTRILMFAISEGDGDPLLWDFTDPYGDESLAAMARLEKALKSEDPIYAHSAMFELAVSTYRMKPDLGLDPPPLECWRCTQAMCKRAAAPESLAQASAFFDLVDKKDAIGKALIGVFSDQNKTVVLEPPPGMKDPATIKQLKNGNFSQGKKPKNRKSNSPVMDDEILWDWVVKVGGVKMTVREAWDQFCEYCRQDVRTERELHRKLERFELKGGILESFQFDLRMNHKGMPVNIPALKHGAKVCEELKESLSKRFIEITGLNPSQREATKKWLQERGYPADDLQASTVEEILEDLPESMTPLATKVLQSYSLIQFAALAKIPAMLNAACDDGYVRGTTQWHAARTGRAGGRIVQPQNYRRPTIPDTDVCYKMVVGEWDANWFSDFWPSPLEALASSIRHFIQPHEGTFYSVDFTGVENRIAAWIVDDHMELARMVAGEDMYKHMAVELFGVSYDNVTKDQRTTAKPVVLACGYQVGGRTLQSTLAKVYKVEKTREECNEYVRIYRNSHENTVDAWKAMQEAAVESIHFPGKKFPILGGRIEFLCGRTAGRNYMTMRLPSGRRLYYPDPVVKKKFMRKDEDGVDWVAVDPEDAGSAEAGFWIDSISYYGKIQNKAQWGRLGTYGGRLFENACQAIGVDLLNYGCFCAEQEGFDIRMIIHDEILAMNDGRPVEELQEAFCRTQPWADGFPLSSSGSVVPYYLKD